MNSINELVDSEQEKEAEKKVIEEFKLVKNNKAYELVQQRLYSLKRGVTAAKAASDYLGSDSRELMIPLLQNLLRGIIESMNENCKECNILDITPGGGAEVDWFLVQELERQAGKRSNNIYLIEPVPEFVESYKQKVNQYHHLTLKKIYDKKVKDYYNKFDAKPSDFIICMNLNHLPDYTESTNPTREITDFVKFIYGQLKPGGAIFITYLDISSDFAKINSLYFKDSNRRIDDIIEAREKLLYNGDILEALKNDDRKTKPKIESHKLSTSYYARNLADIAIMSLDGFLKYNNKPFDIKHLEFLIKEVKNAAKAKVDKGDKRPFGLCKSERGREGLLRVENSQCVCIIRKEIVH